MKALAVRHGLVLGGLLFCGYLFMTVLPNHDVGYDAYAYWSLDLRQPYGLDGGSLGERGAFHYSPAIAQLMAPLGLLPLQLFMAAWMLLLLSTLVFLGRERTLYLLAFPPVALELLAGNINLLIALAIVVGMRHPAAWAFMLLTKVTPGVGLLWFVVRREWRPLTIALGTTALIAAVSLAVAPGLWVQWLTDLAANAKGPEVGPFIPVSLAVRLPAAIALVVWGARTGRIWTVPASAALAVPVAWINDPSILVAIVPLMRAKVEPRVAAPVPVPAAA